MDLQQSSFWSVNKCKSTFQIKSTAGQSEISDIRSVVIICAYLGGPGFGGCLVTGGGGFRRGPPPGEEGAPLTEDPDE